MVGLEICLENESCSPNFPVSSIQQKLQDYFLGFLKRAWKLDHIWTAGFKSKIYGGFCIELPIFSKD